MARTRCSFLYIPEEIIFKILLLLPVTSLVQVRSLCKSWLSVISSPHFIKTHLTNSQKKQPASVLIHRRGTTQIHIESTSRDKYVKFFLPSQFYTPLDLRSGFNFIRSCNGIVCVANGRADVIYLWNPLTNRFKILPTPNIQFPQFETNLFNELMFCFDSISNDYKLLRFEFVSSYRAELYSANADSWKEIQVPYRLRSFRLPSHRSCCPVIEGVLFWEAQGLEKAMLFDWHNEVFREIGVPNSVPYNRRANFFDFEGSVATIGSDLSLWTLDDICGKVSWNKKFKLETAEDSKIDDVYGYLGAGQFVVYTNGVGHMFYDYIKKETKKFRSPFDLYDKSSVVKYTESLVSLKGFERLE